MSDIHVTALETELVRALRAGAPDANGQPAERAVSAGGVSNPCRHCLEFIPEGEDMLIVAHRPFDNLQPYAESGPIFLCARDCERWEGDGLPPVLADGAEDRLVKGYTPDDRIVYGLGQIVGRAEISDRARTVLNDPRVAYVHVRSSTNNCFTCRIDKA